MESLSRLVTPGIKLTALADELGARKHEYAALRALVLQLVEEGVAQILPGGAFALAPSGRANDRKAPKPKQEASDEYNPPDEPGYVPGAPPAKTKPLKLKAAKPAKPAKPAKLPWSSSRPAPARAPAPKRAPAGEYDPETGEVREPGTVAHLGKDDRVIGRITVHPAGYGFVATEAGETVFVPAKYRNLSLDGDRVAVDTWPGVRGTEGRVTEVLARGRARLTGILRKIGRAVYLEPDDPRIAADYGRVHLDDAPMGKDGDAIVIEITRYPDAARKEIAGKLLKVLGDPDDPRTEIEKILACAVIPMEFPDEAIAQAEGTAQELRPTDLANRIDLRDRRFCTIDPETARDFDDALCIEDGPHGGPRVWVAVADVSHYVRWSDALDKEATIRGVSVYLPDRVIPMLPHQLSAGICSLNPMVDRCAMVVRLDYTDEGELHDVGYAAAVIKSKARLDYPGVAAALGGDFRGRREAYRAWLPELERLNKLARILRTKRRARGALELEIAEPKVVLDADDPRLVRDVIKSKGDPAVKGAYELVEEYMIAANEAVGSFFRKRGVPTVWRVHAPPKEDRVAQLAELLGAYGIGVDVEEAVTPLGMKRVLDQINEKPGAQALSFLVLRTLTQAIWDTVPVGHFGLASGDYLHFTSPIRRYPDLLVHRLLKYHLHKDGQPSGDGYTKPPPPVETLTELAHASSGNERRAMEAEREAVAMYRAYLMRDQIREDFEGTVSAVTSFGAFVEIEEPFVEGLIKTESLGDEPFAFDEIHMRLSGRRTGRSISLGDKVKVRIINVSVIRRRIDFELVATAASNKLRPALEPSPRAGIAKRKQAGREVERAQRGRVERGAAPRAAASGGKLRLGVSHRGMRDRDGDEAPRGRGKAGAGRGKPRGKRR
ncbi:MAG TPA: ribonuclease R [Kofleriaceae bacterium]|nr:ribonuclease R [Kofleriaceae bacterium]